MASPASPLNTRLSRSERGVVIGALAAVVVVAWAYLLAGAGMEKHEMGGMSMATMRAHWSASYFLLMVVMWAVMMLAMMLPAAVPMIFAHATVTQNTGLRTAVFVLGYVAVWTAFGLAAALLQWGLASAALFSPMMETSSRTLAASLLLAAGVYQWTPLKQACLRRCRSPLEFVMRYWRAGAWGSFAMGVRHGLFCLGCCWLVMLLLFVGGLMNLAWIAGLALFVLVEKLAPAGHWVGRAAGLVLAGWGIFELTKL